MNNVGKVELIPPNKNIIYYRDVKGKRFQLQRKTYPFLRVGDVFITEDGKSVKILTDDDEIVTMNHPDRKQLVPLGYFN